jgi:hypothetical protein
LGFAIWGFAGAVVFEVLFDSRQRILVVRFGAALTQPAMEAMNAAVASFVQRHGPCPGILDLSAVEEATLPSSYVARLAQRRGVLVDQKRVIVAPSDELFGLARMFGSYNDVNGDRIVAVRTLAQAYEALGIDDLELHPVE